MQDNATPLRRWLPYAAIAAAIYILYVKCLGFQMTGLDDVHLVPAGERYAADLRHLYRVFTGPLLAGTFDYFYRPVLMLTFVFDALLKQFIPFSSHATGMFLHLGASWLIYVLLRKLRYAFPLSLFLALVFAVHPLATSVVAWLPGRNDSLLACSMFGGFICLIEYADSKKLRWLIAHLLCLWTGMLIKENAAVLIPLSGAYLWLVRRREIQRQQYLLPALGWLLVTAAWFFIRAAVIDPQKHAFYYLEILFTQLPAIFQAVATFFVPRDMSNFPFLNPYKVLTGLVVTVAGALLIRFIRPRRPALAWLGAAWFLLFFLPTLVSVQKMVMEHRMYVPVAGLLLICGEMLSGVTLTAARRRLAVAAGSLTLVFLAWQTFTYMDVFMNRRPYWTHAQETAPASPEVHTLMGRYWNERGLPGPAIIEYKTALQLVETDIGRGNINYEMIVVYLQAGMPREAEKILRAQIAGSYPKKGNLYLRYAMLCAREGRDIETEEYFKTAIHHDPDVVDYYRGLADFYGQKRRAADRNAVLAALVRRAKSHPDTLQYVTESSADWWLRCRGSLIKNTPYRSR